jgi:hypothetical protein
VIEMNATEIYTIGDLIKFLSDFDPNKRVFVYDDEYSMENPLLHIDVEDDRIVIYG